MGAWEPSGIKNATIVGRAVAPSEDKFEGKSTELRIAVGAGYKAADGTFKETGTTFLTYVTTGDYAASSKTVGVGDLVKITDASIQTRNYVIDGDAKAGKAIEARYGTLEILERKGEGQKASAPPAGGF